MIEGLVLWIATGIISVLWVNYLKKRYPFVDDGLLKTLFFYHSLLLGVYYVYALYNPSDSGNYYMKVVYDYRGTTWRSFYGTSTTFIEFVAYPFIKYFGFTYEAVMVLFSFLGYLGFVYFYIFFKENVVLKHDFFGVDLVTVFFFLPNLHFWSTSLGKGSIIFMGIGFFFFAISKLRSRLVHLLIGGFIIYHVRPHVMLVVLVSTAIGLIFSTKGVGIPLRVVFLAGAVLAFFYIYQDVLNMVGIEQSEALTEGLNLGHRARELTKATSGIDITNYSLPEQIFAFLFRPLFFDAPGILGIIVSFENVFYLVMTFRILNFKALQFLVSGSVLVKSAFLSFITISIALAQIAGNLGLAMRQKSQVMILLLFVIIMYLDRKKMEAYRQAALGQIKRSRIAQLGKEVA